MPDWLVPLSDVRFTAAEIEAVTDTYRSGWLSQGPKVAGFERAFAASLGDGDAVAVANGTAALQLICAALRLGPGDEVVLPSLTFAATAAAVVHSGATPVFADIRGLTEPWLFAAAVEAAIGDRTRAIINVAYGGHPGDVVALSELADAHGLALIEDAAHALGSSAGGQAVGTFGRAGAFSFFANKNLALGEGGMVISTDPELTSRMRLLRSHGLSADTWARHTGQQRGYEVLEPGFNFRMDEPRAALGTMLLDRLAGDNRRRAELAAAYVEALRAVDGVEPAISAHGHADEASIQNAWHIFPLLLDSALDRDGFRSYLAEAGVQTSVHYRPLHQSPAFTTPDMAPLPITEAYARRTVTVPLFPHMTEAQQGRVLDAVADAAKRFP